MQRDSLRVIDIANIFVTQPSIVTDIRNVNATEIVTWSNRGYYLHDPINARDNDGSALVFVSSTTKKNKRKNNVFSTEKDSTTKPSKSRKKTTKQNENTAVTVDESINNLNIEQKIETKNDTKTKKTLIIAMKKITIRLKLIMELVVKKSLF